jgi:hypothetical protein
MAEEAQFASVPRTEPVLISAANTNRDGTGTIVDGFLPGASGSRVERIRIKAVGTTTTGKVRIFIYDGSTYRLFEEVDVTAATPSASVSSFAATVTMGSGAPLLLPSTRKIGFSTHNAESFICTTVGGDF